jgi:DNA-binding PucR family transcriptional regulator
MRKAAAQLSAAPLLAEQLKNLARIASLVNAGTDLSETLDRITMAVCQRTRWSSSALMALDERQGLSRLVARHDPGFQGRRGAESWDLATSPTRRVLASGRPLVIPSAREAVEFPTFQAEALERDYETVVLLPLSATDAEGRGMVMSVHAHQRIEVDSDELAFLETVAHLASLAVDRALRLLLERQQSDRLRQALAIQTGALEELLSGADLPALVALGLRHLQHPFLLVDLTTDRLLAGGSPGGVETKTWDSALSRPPAPAIAAWLRGLPLAELGEPRTVPGTLLGLSGGTLEAIGGACLVEGTCLGGLLVFTEGRPLSAVEMLIASQLRFALAVSLMRSEARAAARAESLEDLVGRVCAGAWGDRDATLARARRLGLALDLPLRLALLHVPEAEREEMSRLLQRRLARRAGAAALRDGEGFLLLLPEAARGEAASLSLLRALADTVQAATDSTPVLAVGRRCEGLGDFAPARRDLSQMLELALRSGRQGLVQAADFGPFARFMAAADSAALRGLLDETLGRIEREGGTALVETLAAFLEEQGRFQAAADRLGVHVTTLRYRLRRLAERFGLDLAQPDNRLALALALRARSLLEAPEPPPRHRGSSKKT